MPAGALGHYWSQPRGWLHLPTHRMLAFGLAVGRARSDSPVNQLETERAPLDHFARFHGR
jgi:hypothetical protein